MPRTSLAVCMLFVTLSLVLTGAKAAPLYNPDPIVVPCRMSIDDVKKSITTALAGRTWKPIEKGSGLMTGIIVVREKHTLVVDIEYSVKSVLIRYKNSDNLEYRVKDGIPHIHKRASSWIRNIENDTRMNMTRHCMTS